MARPSERASIMLRVQEVIANSTEPLTGRDALRRVLAERFKDDPAGLLDYAASASESWLGGLRKRTYELPEGDALFELPLWIGIATPDGDLFVSRECATVDQARQWVREGRQHHSTQSLRFERAASALEAIADVPGETPWWEARALMAGAVVAIG